MHEGLLDCEDELLEECAYRMAIILVVLLTNVRQGSLFENIAQVEVTDSPRSHLLGNGLPA